MSESAAAVMILASSAVSYVLGLLVAGRRHDQGRIERCAQSFEAGYTLGLDVASAATRRSRTQTFTEGSDVIAELSRHPVVAAIAATYESHSRGASQRGEP